MCRPPLVGEGNIPEEIWLIKTEPTSRPTVPVEPDEILDRRKQMEGNCALMNQLGILNEIFLLGGYTPELLEVFAVGGSRPHPQDVRRMAGEALYIPHIEMSPELYRKIDWEAKLDREAENIDMLMEDGRKRAREFLKACRRVIENSAHAGRDQFTSLSPEGISRSLKG